jgi:DNA-binding NarL/FixJ family response regulator
MRVIVAEDSGLIGGLLATGLAGHGVDVVGVARTIQALLELVEAAPADAVTLDLNMPRTETDTTMERGSGLDAARHIRHVCPRLALVAVTQEPEVPWVEEIIRLGPRTGYLLKDRIEDIPELIRTIDAVIGGDTRVDPTLVTALLDRKRVDDQVDRFTPREREVFDLIAQGYSNKAIVRRIFLAESTVEGYERSIYRKLGLTVESATDDADSRHRRVMAVITYLRRGRRPS